MALDIFWRSLMMDLNREEHLLVFSPCSYSNVQGPEAVERSSMTFDNPESKISAALNAL